MSPQFDWRDLAASAADSAARHRPPERELPELVLRELQRLHALGRTPDDIATLLGMNPADVRLLIYGDDAS